ncbi:MucR family transcriptional regulator [Novosphingobium sp. KACC 22771]|uniref:MucR family transcriptional regulator n=1 Tax=Novosphingobium sp. KACC 22771 TaxID=3025670 RepID=UPI0023673AD0|nr:MucR family transcriptional regulator [Novosphingobium sp. KACC 22771]WDF74206.1 MucR family transcriptional regulator [Novosphingobium sp. KACC 22771]
MAENNSEGPPNFIELAGDITIAWLQNPNVDPAAEDVPAFLKSMHLAIVGLDEAPAAEPEPEVVAYEPAVPARSSIKPDYLVSLIDGRKYKTLKRHLAANGLTPDAYRARYGLKSDYPMVAANFAAMRREIAEKIGLGRKSAARLDNTDGTVVAPAETQEAALPATEEDVAAVVVAKGVARKPKARTDKTSVASTKASPPLAEVKPAADAKGKPARATRKVKQEDAPPVDAPVPAEPVKPVAPRRQRMAREPEVLTSGTDTPDAPVADPVPGGPSARKGGAAKAKATSLTEVGTTGNKAVRPAKAKGTAGKTVKAKVADPKQEVMLEAVPAPANRGKVKKSATKTEAPAAKEV